LTSLHSHHGTPCCPKAAETEFLEPLRAPVYTQISFCVSENGAVAFDFKSQAYSRCLNAMTSPKIPILLLKTKSTPNDSYEENFSTPTSPFTPIFVPVLEHKPNVGNLEHVKALLWDGGLKGKYGGMIFTSQRAVEGFVQVVRELEHEKKKTGNGEQSSRDQNNSQLSTIFTHVLFYILTHFISLFASFPHGLACTSQAIFFPVNRQNPS
jgi:Uroporphyrinogen-III synthase HemD